MIVLLLGSAPEHSTGSTSQPRQEKGFWRQLPTLRLGPHSMGPSLRGFSDPTPANGKARKPRQKFAEAKAQSLSASRSLNHSAVSINVWPENELCLVCDAHSSAFCPACEQNFCTNHLYVCLDCDRQFCSSCFEDHRVDGHWSDSDTNAELSHGRTEKLVPVIVLRGGKCASPPFSDSTQYSCNNQAAYSSIIRVFRNWKATQNRVTCPPADRNRSSSQILHPKPLTSFFARITRAGCLWGPSYAAQALVNSSSQLSPEVCL